VFSLFSKKKWANCLSWVLYSLFVKKRDPRENISHQISVFINNLKILPLSVIVDQSGKTDTGKSATIAAGNTVSILNLLNF
jgi:hypothetical protein